MQVSVIGGGVIGSAIAWNLAEQKQQTLLVEKNQPATFTHPFWSLISDYRMAFIWLTERLKSELYRAGVPRR